MTDSRAIIIITDRKLEGNSSSSNSNSNKNFNNDEWGVQAFLSAFSELSAGYEVKKTLTVEEASSLPATELNAYDTVIIVTHPETHLTAIKVITPKLTNTAKSTSIFCNGPLALTEEDVRECYSLYTGNNVTLNVLWPKRCNAFVPTATAAAASDKKLGGKIVDKEAPPPTTPPFTQQSSSSSAVAALSALRTEHIPYALLGDLNLILGVMEEQLPTSVQLCHTETEGALMCIVDFLGGRVRYRISYKASSAAVTGPSYYKAAGPGAPRVPMASLSSLLPLALTSTSSTDTGLEIELATLKVAECARRSLALDGSRVSARHPGAPAPLRLVCVGESSAAETVAEVCNACLCVSELDTDVLEIPGVNGVFLSSANGDGGGSSSSSNVEAAKACLARRARVLAQVPIRPEAFTVLREYAAKKDALLTVDFFKRFDTKFAKAKSCLMDVLGNPLTRKLESLRVDHAISAGLLERIYGDAFSEVARGYLRTALANGGDDDDDDDERNKNVFAEEFVYGCLIHDIDLISWLFDGVQCEITVVGAKCTTTTSSNSNNSTGDNDNSNVKGVLSFSAVFSISVLTVKNPIAISLEYKVVGCTEGSESNNNDEDDDEDENEKVKVKEEEESRRAGSGLTYLNTITINGEVFGHNSEHKQHYDVGKQFRSAYANELCAFAAHPLNKPGQGTYARCYTRTFALAEKTFEALITAAATTTTTETVPQSGKQPKPSIQLSLSPHSDSTPPPEREDDNNNNEEEEEEENNNNNNDNTSSKVKDRSTDSKVISVSPETHVEFAKLWKENNKTAAEVQLILRNHVSRGQKQSEAAEAAHGDESMAVAGHGGIFKRDGMLFKSLAFNEDEWCVYAYLLENFPEILPFIPHIYGRRVVNGYPFFAMEDLTKGYSRPAVLDLKLGEPGHFLNIHNEPFSMKVAGYSGTRPIAKSQQSWHDLVAYFRDYLREKDSGNIRYDVIPDFVAQVEKMYALFTKQSKIKLKATSLLFVYESDESVVVPKKPQVKLIDFARAIIYEKKGRSLLLSAPAPSGSLPPLVSATPGSLFAGSFADLLAEQKAAKESGRPLPQLPPTASDSLYDSVDAIDHFFCNGLANLRKLLSSIFKKFVKRNSLFLCRDDITPGPGSTGTCTGKGKGEEVASRANYISDILRNERVSVVISRPTEREAKIGQLVASSLGIAYSQDPLLETLSTSPSATDAESLSKLQEVILPSLSDVCAKHKRIAIIGKPKLFTEILSVLMGQPWEVSLDSSNIIALVPCPSSPLGWNIERMAISNSFFTSNDDLQYSQ